MIELSMHILDIVENSIRARARRIYIRVIEDTLDDTLKIIIEDDGEGMDDEKRHRAFDPFFTTKTVRSIGLGIPLLDQAACLTGGRVDIEPRPEGGTRVTAVFTHSHIDRQPVGNMGDTMTALITGNPELDFIYRHHYNGRAFELDTRRLRKELEDVPLQSPAVANFIRTYVNENIRDISTSADVSNNRNRADKEENFDGS